MRTDVAAGVPVVIITGKSYKRRTLHYGGVIRTCCALTCISGTEKHSTHHLGSHLFPVLKKIIDPMQE